MKWLLLVAGILLGCIVSYEWHIAQLERSTLEQVQAGEVILRCDMPDGTRDIDPELVVDYHDGQWTFTNGFSGTCTLVVK